MYRQYNPHRFPGRSVLERIFDQIAHDYGECVRLDPRRRGLVGQVELDRLPRCNAPKILDDKFQYRAQILRRVQSTRPFSDFASCMSLSLTRDRVCRALSIFCTGSRMAAEGISAMRRCVCARAAAIGVVRNSCALLAVKLGSAASARSKRAIRSLTASATGATSVGSSFFSSGVRSLWPRAAMMPQKRRIGRSPVRTISQMPHRPNQQKQDEDPGDRERQHSEPPQPVLPRVDLAGCAAWSVQLQPIAEPTQGLHDIGTTLLAQPAHTYLDGVAANFLVEGI